LFYFTENLFGTVKVKLRDLEIHNFEAEERPKKLAFEVQKAMYELSKLKYEGFYSRVLNNMVQFWLNINRNKLLRKIRKYENRLNWSFDEFLYFSDLEILTEFYNVFLFFGSKKDNISLKWSDRFWWDFNLL